MGNWWRTMRIRQTKLARVAVRCVSRQKPHRFLPNLESQSRPRRFYYAQLGEPLCHRGITDWTFELRHTFFILPFGIFQTIPTESSPKQFPWATAFAVVRLHTRHG